MAYEKGHVLISEHALSCEVQVVGPRSLATRPMRQYPQLIGNLIEASPSLWQMCFGPETYPQAVLRRDLLTYQVQDAMRSAPAPSILHCRSRTV